MSNSRCINSKIRKVRWMDRIIGSIRENWILYLVFLLYTILIIVAATRHEPWADEAQAWLLARDSSLFGLLFKNLHYEGHPPLWHLILMLPSRILPYRFMSVISILIAMTGVYILLRRSPFPKIVKIFLPFSYFLFYQYGVIARNYVLVPVLLFMIARIYEDKVDRIYPLTILACLLANSSIFATLVAMSIMFVHLVDLIRMRSELSRELIVKQMKAYAVFIGAIALIVIQLWQPKDSSFAVAYNFSILHFLRLTPRVMNLTMTRVSYISAIVLIISLIWFCRKKLLLLYLTSNLAIFALFSIKYYNRWHQGVVFMTWIFVMWLSFQDEEQKDTRRLPGLGRMAVVLSILLVLGFHVYWAASASISDFGGTYSSGKVIADYIKANDLEDKEIHATTFWSTTVQPYFRKNIFANHNNGKTPSFWLWSTNTVRIQDMNSILEAQPDLIIVGRPNVKEIKGYRFAGAFAGELYWKNGIMETNDFALFRRLQM